MVRPSVLEAWEWLCELRGKLAAKEVGKEETAGEAEATGAGRREEDREERTDNVGGGRGVGKEWAPSGTLSVLGSLEGDRRA